MAGVNIKVSGSDKIGETILDRLHKLVGDRPLRDVSEAWGIPRSTLNNYFYRGSHPKIDVLKRIAEKEEISFEWLVNGVEGEGETNISKKIGESKRKMKLYRQSALKKRVNTKPPEVACDAGLQTLVSMWDALEPKEKDRLHKLLLRKGAEFLAQLLDEENICLLQLSGEKREAALILAQLVPERVREILSELRASRDMAGAGHQQDVDDQHKGVA
ncbi:helix-turn-helix domain-containing protein [Salmonella enterica]|nr:helix-turn-helix domain-containing protein [Salmonella enterica]